MTDYLGLTGRFGIAHRGGSHEHLENSLTAFRHAAELGLPVIETDVHATADGVLAVIHDRDLKIAASSRRRIAELNWAELSTMRMRNGDRVLRLEELLEEFADLRFNIDPKSTAAVAPLVRLLEQAPAWQARVCLGSFETAKLRYLRQALPAVATSLGSTEIRQLVIAVRTGRRFAWPERVVATQVPQTAFGVRIVTPAFVDFVRSAYRQVHVWTVDDAVEMERLYALGVNAVMTDRPSVLKAVLQARGDWPATEVSE